MKTSLKLGGLVAAMMLTVSGASFAADATSPYVHSTDGQVVKNPFGLCWRTGFWTPALAEAQGRDGEVALVTPTSSPLLSALRLLLRPLLLRLRLLKR